MIGEGVIFRFYFLHGEVAIVEPIGANGMFNDPAPRKIGGKLIGYLQFAGYRGINQTIHRAVGLADKIIKI